MICPSGLLSGRFMRSMSSASNRFTGTSSGASTSLTRLPDTSRTLMRVVGIRTSFASVREQTDDGQREHTNHQHEIPNQREPDANVIGTTFPERGHREASANRSGKQN